VYIALVLHSGSDTRSPCACGKLRAHDSSAGQVAERLCIERRAADTEQDCDRMA
jgi:hypothetical protein